MSKSYQWVFLMALFSFFSSYSMQPVNEDIGESEKNLLAEKEFEKIFHEHFNNPEDEEKASFVLAKAQAEVNHQNEMYDKGEANFKEGKCLFLKYFSIFNIFTT